MTTIAQLRDRADAILAFMEKRRNHPRIIEIAALLLAGCVAEQPPWDGVLPPPRAYVPDSGEVVEYIPCDAGLECVAVRVTVLE